MTDRLTALDATFLELEQMDEGATMHTVGVMVFDPLPDGSTPTLESVCTEVVSRLTLLPRYSARLSSERTGGMSWPHWQEDPQFDLRNHVRRTALPAPGGDVELCEWEADFASHRLDRTRPLWELVLVEGLEHGRWALAMKTHHALVDGVGLVDVVHLLLDPEAPSTAAPALAEPEASGAQWPEHVPHPPDALAGLARTGVHAAVASVHAARHPREALERSRALVELVASDELSAAPHSSLNVPIGATRRFEIVRATLPDLKAIGGLLGGSVNDVLLAVCAAGLRRLLLERGDEPPPEGLRAMVPMNVRSASEQLALGNRVSSLFVDLPVAEPDAAERVRRVVEHTSRLKSSGAALGASTMIDLAALAPPLLHAPIARSLYATRLFNLTITNVPGPRTPMRACGAVLREIHPIVPLAAEHSVGIAIFSYDGGVVLGLSADRDSTHDLHVLVEGVEDALAELCALLPSAARGPSARRRITEGAPPRSATEGAPPRPATKPRAGASLA